MLMKTQLFSPEPGSGIDARHRLRLASKRRGRAEAVFPTIMDEPDGKEKDDDTQNGVEAMEVLAQGYPALAHLHSGVGKREAPGQ